MSSSLTPPSATKKASQPTPQPLPVPPAAAEPAPTVVRFDHVTKQFNPQVRGLDDVSVEIARGEITVLLGLSGSGKSTFLRHVNGLQQPTSGHINVLGQAMEHASKPTLRSMRRRIGFIFQDFNLVGPMSVLENVCTGRLGALKGPRLGLMFYPKQVRQEALEQLERVGLVDRAYQRADTLSGGQQQRVAIARALIQHPDILLADEPVASLDPVSSRGVIELLQQISREKSLTVICSLHQVEIALNFGDRIIGLRSGKVVMDERTAEVGRDEVLSIYSKVSDVPDYPDFSESAGAVEVDLAGLKPEDRG
ncbi:phosphonate ABC transporter ATP-binding protein [Granulicoccus phenolivorans]|uniref:phosphonate ABC transporter ATP-binding protein n=1 Tax=Granulicoccus phenolivorans TaxID=266854 RepID=UPI0004060456|nr:phosphonate ABC transporter ATP-binding protein [Granulicoccus phenolivorans]